MAIESLFDLLAAVFRGKPRGDGSGATEQARIAPERPRGRAAIRAQVASCPLLQVANPGDGPAGFEGHARPLELIAAPLSGRPVIGYRLRLVGAYYEGEEIERTLLDVSLVREFELCERETQRVARIRPERCLPLIEPEPRVTLELADLVKPPLGPIVERALIPTSELVTARALHAVEHLLEPGEPVFAFGIASRELEPGAETGYRETPWRTVLSAPPEGVLILADQHRDALLASLAIEPEIFPE